MRVATCPQWSTVLQPRDAEGFCGDETLVAWPTQRVGPVAQPIHLALADKFSITMGNEHGLGAKLCQARWTGCARRSCSPQKILSSMWQRWRAGKIHALSTK